MTPASKSTFVLGHRHLLGIEGLSAADISGLLDLSEEYVELNRQVDKKRSSLRGRTQVNLFFEASTRTQSSFEIAGKRLGADVMNMSVSSSSMRKGETLMDTAVTLNAMHPDILVVRHHASGAVELLARKVDGSVVNAGDGAHEHPTQALLDALTIRRNKGRLEGLVIAICGDVLHSRVAVPTSSCSTSWAPASAWWRPRRCCRAASSGWASRWPATCAKGSTAPTSS